MVSPYCWFQVCTLGSDSVLSTALCYGHYSDGSGTSKTPDFLGLLPHTPPPGLSEQCWCGTACPWDWVGRGKSMFPVSIQESCQLRQSKS